MRILCTQGMVTPGLAALRDSCCADRRCLRILDALARDRGSFVNHLPNLGLGTWSPGTPCAGRMETQPESSPHLSTGWMRVE
jgi:hypothetical protein